MQDFLKVYLESLEMFCQSTDYFHYVASGFRKLWGYVYNNLFKFERII